MVRDSQEELISAIVPIYNVEQYLRECLDSLLRQTYSNLEILLVDDGSKDLSGEICDEYAEKYENFIAIHKENAGLGMARNTGMEHMTGDLVTFVDSDDFLEPDCIEILYKGLRENKVDMCKGGFRRVTDGRKVKSIRKYKEEVFENEEAKKKLLPRMVGSLPSQHDSIEMCVWGAIYDAGVIRKHGIRFPSERELISEDLVFNIDYMQHAVGACTIEYVGYNYRINSGSLTTSYREDRFEACRHFYQEMEGKLTELGYSGDTLLRLKKIFLIYLKMCIAQERKRISRLGRSDSIKNIRKICNDGIVEEVINSYPINELGLPHKIFVELMRLKMAGILYFIFTLKEDI